jgi:hypothetical protein
VKRTSLRQKTLILPLLDKTRVVASAASLILQSVMFFPDRPDLHATFLETLKVWIFSEALLGKKQHRKKDFDRQEFVMRWARQQAEHVRNLCSVSVRGWEASRETCCSLPYKYTPTIRRLV